MIFADALIWIGNTLLPRGLVFGVAGAILLIIIATFVILTRGSWSNKTVDSR